MNTSASGVKNGFGLLELVIVLAIMGTMIALLIPKLNLRTIKPIQQLVQDIATLTTICHEQAIITGITHRLFFRFGAHADVSVQKAKLDTSKHDKQTFEKAMIDYNKTTISFDPRFNVQNFYIGGIDEAKQGTLKEAWIFFLPDGATQDIIINITDRETQEDRSLVLNPISARFTVYEMYQHPAKERIQPR